MTLAKSLVRSLVLVAAGAAAVAAPHAASAQPTPSYKLYCQGPLAVDAQGHTAFAFAPVGAGQQAPGTGQCAWADRGARGSELQADNGNQFCAGFRTDITLGQYILVAAYRNAEKNNCIVVTHDYGRVFSSNPSV